jgi:hypothetical protein
MLQVSLLILSTNLRNICLTFALYCDNGKEIIFFWGTRVILNILKCVANPAFQNHLYQPRSFAYRATKTVRENKTGNCPLHSSKQLKMDGKETYDYLLWWGL